MPFPHGVRAQESKYSMSKDNNDLPLYELDKDTKRLVETALTLAASVADLQSSNQDRSDIYDLLDTIADVFDIEKHFVVMSADQDDIDRLTDELDETGSVPLDNRIPLYGDQHFEKPKPKPQLKLVSNRDSADDLDKSLDDDDTIH
jgi:hypothetical protein|tara:strand:+ start:264 stop:701 length:438 start_codon:yes stop_codon:yes gene_type:complete